MNSPYTWPRTCTRASRIPLLPVLLSRIPLPRVLLTRISLPHVLLVAAPLLVSGCASTQTDTGGQPPTAPAPPPPGHPAEVPPGETGDAGVWEAALRSDRTRIVVSRDARRLWLLRADTTVFTAPIAIGRDTVFRYGDREYDFSTPTGRRVVLGKEESPDWVPPDWHYFELAVERGLEPFHLKRNQRVLLSDSTWIEVRNGVVGRINRFGNWHPFTPGSEIIFDGRVFVPPIPSPQRRIPKVLGTHRLILGDGYLIHGTPEVDSIGQEASHGCVRMLNQDVQTLYGLVGKGTDVYIY